jgi:hypothetical protein
MLGQMPTPYQWPACSGKTIAVPPPRLQMRRPPRGSMGVNRAVHSPIRPLGCCEGIGFLKYTDKYFFIFILERNICLEIIQHLL